MSEHASLRPSALASLAVGAAALVFWGLSGSQAILLDAAFNLLFFGMGLLTLRVHAMLERPADRLFPYGYASFEPLLNTVKGLMILGVSLMALLPAVAALFSGGRYTDTSYGAAYGASATAVATLVAAVQHRAAQRTQSPLIRADAQNWIANAVISAAVALAFGGALISERSGLHQLVPYVDPALVTLVVLTMLPIPSKMVRHGVGELLLRGPSASTQQAFAEVLESTLPEHFASQIDIKMALVGRRLFVSVYCVVPSEAQQPSISELDRVRGSMLEALLARDPRVVLDVSFTTSDRFIAARA